MKKITVWMEDAEQKALAAEAKKRGLSVSQVARERILGGAENADFAVYRADQQDAFRRVSGRPSFVQRGTDSPAGSAVPVHSFAVG